MNITGNMASPLGVKRSESFTIAWGKNATPPEDPFLEAEAREVIQADESVVRGHAQFDNLPTGDHWGADLDASPGRVLRRSGPMDAGELKDGTLNVALSARFDPEKKTPQSLDITSENHNFTHHTLWNNGDFQSTHFEKVLKDGTKEVLELSVDSAKGTLTYTTSLVPPQA